MVDLPGPSGELDKTIDNILKHRFMEPFNMEGDDANGLILNNVYIPEEMLIKILALINPDDVLVEALVCKRWNNIVKSSHFWVQICNRKHLESPKNHLPWYVFYCYVCQKLLNCNLLINGNGQLGYSYWDIENQAEKPFDVEYDPALNTNVLPGSTPEFNKCNKYFITRSGVKQQQVNLLDHSKLLFYIVNKLGPDIYLSDWVAGRCTSYTARCDCPVTYTLTCNLYQKEFKRFTKTVSYDFNVANGERKWKKVKATERLKIIV